MCVLAYVINVHTINILTVFAYVFTQLLLFFVDIFVNVLLFVLTYLVGVYITVLSTCVVCVYITLVDMKKLFLLT